MNLTVITETIESISRYFVSDYRTAIVPMTTACIPAAIEAIRLFKGIYQDPDSIKRNLDNLKSAIWSACHKRKNESTESFAERKRSNVTIIAIAILAISGTVGAPFLILPMSFALPCALSAVYGVGRLIYHSYHNPLSIRKIKDYLSEAFTQKDQEPMQEFHFRRWKAIGKIALYSLIFAVSIGTTIALPYAIQTISQIHTVWELTSFIPLQTKTVVFAEYVALGFLHLVQACRSRAKSDYIQSTSHLTAAGMAFFFPLWYLLAPGNEMRLHHSFTGLLLQLAPLQTLRTFGAFITADSALYCLTPQRGYRVNRNHAFVSYDYMNAVYEHFSSVLQNLTAVSIFEKLVDFLLQKPTIQHLTSCDSLNGGICNLTGELSPKAQPLTSASPALCP